MRIVSPGYYRTAMIVIIIFVIIIMSLTIRTNNDENISDNVNINENDKCDNNKDMCGDYNTGIKNSIDKGRRHYEMILMIIITITALITLGTVNILTSIKVAIIAY